MAETPLYMRLGAHPPLVFHVFPRTEPWPASPESLAPTGRRYILALSL